MKVGRIKEIRRYPVKSMGGEKLEEVELATRGIPGDRVWAIRDEVRGGIHGAKRIPALLNLRACFAKPPDAEGSSPALITFPDGSTVETGDPAINARLSEAIDRDVTLWPILPAEALDHYRRSAPVHEDLEQELRAMFGRDPDEPLPDLSIFPPELIEFQSPPGSYFDAFPVNLLTEASLRQMQERNPGSIYDVRRFRPNFLISDCDSSIEFPEQAWPGRRVRIGEAILQIKVDCPRCVIVTHAFEDLPKDPKVMRALVKESGGNLGVYATVETPGRIRAGDDVVLLAE